MDLSRALLAGWFAVASNSYSAAIADDVGPHARPEPAGIAGAVVLVAAGDLPTTIKLETERLLARVIRVSPVPLADEALPGVIAVANSGTPDTHKRLIAAVTEQPNTVGVGLSDKAALVIQGREMRSIGEGSVTVVLAAGAGRPLQEIELLSGAKHDLTMLRKAAHERAVAEFPPSAPPPPRIESGALVIAGGGQLPRSITNRFLELAGGPDSPIVILPIAAGDELPEDTSGDTRVLTRAGASNVRSLRARTRSEIESPEFAMAIRQARGVWFGGGRQWRFVDAYLGTPAEDLFRDVLRRGGVIGGSSAGASIQGQYMPRGSPLGNEEVAAEGYERGLGFLPGTAIDQHFSERRRQGDLTRLMRRYPQLLGIGIDEGTAVVVQGATAQIIGRGQAHFFDYREGPPMGQRDYTSVGAGAAYDLVQRKVALNANPVPAP